MKLHLICDKCNFIAPYKYDLEVHKKIHLIDTNYDTLKYEDYFSCDRKCGWKFNSMQRLWSHEKYCCRQSNFTILEIKILSEHFTCYKCGFVFGNKESLELHNKNFPFVYYCNCCNKSWCNKLKITDHFKYHPENSIYKYFDYNNTIQETNSIKYIPDMKIYSCEKKYNCTTKFDNFNNFDIHGIVSHDIYTNYVCPLCKSSHGSLKKLKLHIRAKHKEN